MAPASPAMAGTMLCLPIRAGGADSAPGAVELRDATARGQGRHLLQGVRRRRLARDRDGERGTSCRG
jgi:hypothetical protein